jgi:hypothetical protein
MFTATVNTKGLGQLINDLRTALIGSGQKGDLTEIVVDETRRLAMECGKAPTLKQRHRLETSIKRDIGSVFLAMPSQPIPAKHRHGKELEWLAAGPNFLIGARKNQILAGSSNLSAQAGGGIRQLLYKLRGKLPKKKYEDVGKHGKQLVRIPNRVMVSKTAITGLFYTLKKRVGIRDASFAETAKKLGESKISATISRHFPTKKNITQLEGLKNPENPVITFGSNAKGVSGIVRKVHAAVEVRKRKIQARIKLILRGYAKDNSTGIIRKNSHEP